MQLFLAEHIADERGYLGKAESHHAIRVLRMNSGQKVLVSQGDGMVYYATLSDGSPQRAHFSIDALYRQQSPPSLHMAVAPTKSNDRFHFFLEKATELGIASVQPLICHHSERRVYKEERGRKVIMAAVKQSKKGYIPHLHAAIKFNDFLEALPEMPAYMAHLQEDTPALALNELPFDKPLLVLVGPEGDFSDEEIRKAQNQGIGCFQMGTETLRTETAAVTVAAANALRKI